MQKLLSEQIADKIEGYFNKETCRTGDDCNRCGSCGNSISCQNIW